MSRPTVLVVDDEKPIRAFATKALTAAGYEPQTAANGPEALRRIETFGRPFDVFVIDLLMPHMPGTELAQQIRRTNPSAKILYFTGFVDRLFEEKQRLWQDEAFIEKPIEMGGFLEAVSLLLFGHTKGPASTFA